MVRVELRDIVTAADLAAVMRLRRAPGGSLPWLAAGADLLWDELRQGR